MRFARSCVMDGVACSRLRELKPLLRLVDRIEGIEAATGFAYGRV